MPKLPPPTLTRRDLVAPSDMLAGARRLPLVLIDANPQQSRQVFDETKLAELAASIKEHGVLEPILVRPVGERFQIVAGERRTRAAHLAGLRDIPALSREMTDAEAAYTTAIENLQREDLDIEDEARQFAALLSLTGLSQGDLAPQLGVSKVYLSERVRMLTRPDLLAAYRAGELTWKQALAALNTTPPPPPLYARRTETIAPSYNGPTAPAPRPLERAALDQATGTGDTRPTIWRERGFDGAATTFLRMNWATVPADKRATVAAQLELIERAARAARQMLLTSGEE